MISRRSIKRIVHEPQSYGDQKKQFPRVTVRSDGTHSKVVNYSQRIRRDPLLVPLPVPISFLQAHQLPAITNDICFVVGGGPSLSGFDFNLLSGFDTIAINKTVEYIQNPKYFITTDYSYFAKGTLPIESIRQKTEHVYFVANMTHPYMELKNGMITDTRGLVYEDLHKCNGVIESNNIEGFSSDVVGFASGSNSGHCGIQLALLLGYKKIYLLGFDLSEGAHTHFHQSYTEFDKIQFRKNVGNYKRTLFSALESHKGSQEIINLSSQSNLAESPFIKTESFYDIINQDHSNNKTLNVTPNSKIPADAPQNLMVVGYYTVNTPYEQEAQNLIQSLNRLGLEKDIVGVNTLGNWQANTRFKASFMLDMLIKYPNHRLLYVDCDAVLHKMPILFNNYNCDIAVRWQDFKWRKNECLSGTIYMENNHKTQRLCRLWRDININEGNASTRMEQWNLDTVITTIKGEDPTFAVKNLPPEYTFIFDSMKHIYPAADPIIEHFQASRRFKNDVNTLNQ